MRAKGSQIIVGTEAEEIACCSVLRGLSMVEGRTRAAGEKMSVLLDSGGLLVVPNDTFLSNSCHFTERL